MTPPILKGGQGRPSPDIESVFSGAVLWLTALVSLIVFFIITSRS